MSKLHDKVPMLHHQDIIVTALGLLVTLSVGMHCAYAESSLSDVIRF